MFSRRLDGTQATLEVFAAKSFSAITSTDTRDGLSDAVKAYFADEVKQELSGHVQSAIKEAAAGLVSAFAGKLAANFLGALLQATDGVKLRLDKLIQEPYKTGIALASRGLKLVASDEEERRTRDEVLMAAILSLDRAHTLLSDYVNWAGLSAHIRFIQGLCALQKTGGKQAASSYFAEARPYVENLIHSHSKTASLLDTKADGLKAYSDKGPRSGSMPSGPMNARGRESWLDMQESNIADWPNKRDELLKRAAVERAKAVDEWREVRRLELAIAIMSEADVGRVASG